MSTTDYQPFQATEEDINALKRSYASLKGWIKRKNIEILDNARYDAYFVEYQGRYMVTKAWFLSPRGRDDADLVQRYMEAKAKLEKLGEL